MWTFDYPQTYAVTGSADEQITQLRTYIWQLVDALNQAGDDNAQSTAVLTGELERLKKLLGALETKRGHSLPTGGDTGQVLMKLSGGDYDTGWRTVSGSGGGGGTVQSVNSVLPDAAGNVQLGPEDVGAVDEDEELTILEIIDMWNNA